MTSPSPPLGAFTRAGFPDLCGEQALLTANRQTGPGSESPLSPNLVTGLRPRSWHAVGRVSQVGTHPFSPSIWCVALGRGCSGGADKVTLPSAGPSLPLGSWRFRTLETKAYFNV